MRSSPTAGAVIAHIIGIAIMLVAMSIVAFGGGALYELLSAAFAAGRQFISATLWAWL